MTPLELTIGSLFHQRQPFKIPKYQRAYAWKKDEIDEFCSDLLAAWVARQEGNQRPYFFGSIVSIMHNAHNMPGREYEVIDGQQRLATFSMLFSLIIEQYREIAERAQRQGHASENVARTYAEIVRTEYLYYRDVRQGQAVDLLRLNLSKVDDDLFQNLIAGGQVETTRESHKLIKDAYTRVRKNLVKEVVDSRRPIDTQLEALRALEQTVMEDCIVIHLVADSREEAYRLFQVLNDRGVGLTEGDLLRSSTLELLESHPALQQRAERAWDEILAFDASETASYLMGYYSSHKGKRPRRRMLYDDFYRDFFKSYAQQPVDPVRAESITSHVVNMQEELEVYKILGNAAWPYPNPHLTVWDQAQLPRLVQGLKHTLCMPFLLAASKLAEPAFADIVTSLGRFVFRYVVVCKRHVGKLNNLYLQESHRIRKSPSLYCVSEFQAKLCDLATDAPDQLFETSLRQELTYKQRGNNSALKFFLVAIEDYSRWYREGAEGEPVCRDKSIVIDVDTVQIEHIYPQSPILPEEGLEPLKHNLGNLSIWASNDNRAASNAAFADKRSLYANSHLRMTRELADLTSWSIASISSRENQLVQLALAVFKF